MVVAPRSSPIAMNSSKSERPVITSGITNGAYIMPENKVRPKKRPPRTITKAAMVPKIVAIDDDHRPTFKVTQAASKKASFESNSVYHLVEKPAHTVTSFDLLKLKITKIMIGIYKKAKPIVRDTTLNQVAFLIDFAPSAFAHCAETRQWE